MRRALAIAVALLVLAAGCGDDDDALPEVVASSTTTEPPPSTTALADAPVPAPTGGVIELDAEPPRRLPAGPHTWEIEVANTGDAPVTITFPSGQDGDAVLEKDDGTVVHRWSDGRFFDQAVREVTVAAGETTIVQLADDLSAVEPGFYRLRLTLAVVEPPEPFEQNLRLTPAD